MLGISAALPNPCVGACLVIGDEVVAEGITAPYGGPHAEVNAVRALRDKSLLPRATMYVTLEPCCHHGKTGPCTDLIIQSGISRVVIGALDDNPLVAGRGMKALKEAGIEVRIADLQAACRFSNRRFLSIINNNRPYIILKWAETRDGIMDKSRIPGEQGVNWITHASTKTVTHRWRAMEHAILVGTATVAIDNPSLTVRHANGPNPVRIVIDRSLSLPPDRKVFSSEAPTIILNEVKTKVAGHLHHAKIDFSNFFSELFRILAERNIWSLIVEGGRSTLDAFIQSGYYDEVRVLVGAREFQGGLKSPGRDRFESARVPLEKDELYISMRNGFSLDELTEIMMVSNDILPMEPLIFKPEAL